MSYLSRKGSFDSLVGLSLLPVEDGTLATVQGPTHPHLYLVDAAERKLLAARAGGRIVVADSVLGSVVTGVLRHASCAQHTNIRPLTPEGTTPHPF